MPVSSSTATFEGPQADGSRWCLEAHALAGGQSIEYRYLTLSDMTQAQVDAKAAARAALVDEWLREREYQRTIERDGAFTLAENSAAQFAARLREDFGAGADRQACYLAWWLLRRIAAGHVTDAQCRTAFGLTTTQWNNVKTNTLTPRSNAYAAMNAAGGI